MLSDHAWNGTDGNNQKHNAELRRNWSEELVLMAQKLLDQGWQTLGLQPDGQHVTVFNSLSEPRRGLVRIAVPEQIGAIMDQGREIPCQLVSEESKRILYFVAPEVAGFGLEQLELMVSAHEVKSPTGLSATATQLESPYYRLAVDAKTGGLSSLIHKASGKELVVPGKGRGMCQTVYFEGKEHLLGDLKSEVVAAGPVLARLRITGTAAGIEVVNFVTVYADLDQVDFDLRITKPVTTKENRLSQVFPILPEGAALRIATTGAVIRPRPQPQGDLLPGADTRRFAVQEFLSAAGDELSVTIAPLDAFVARLDLDPVSIEAVGNDQNYKEVIKDQNGVTQFRVRYSLRADAKPFQEGSAYTFSRAAATPLVAVLGRVGTKPDGLPAITVDPARAVATCLKPADDPDAGGVILRLQEVAGQSGPAGIALKGYRKVVQTDLLERDVKEVPIVNGKATLELRPHGLCALRLIRE
jgi:alpha-mannosidase